MVDGVATCGSKQPMCVHGNCCTRHCVPCSQKENVPRTAGEICEAKTGALAKIEIVREMRGKDWCSSEDRDCQGDATIS